jgi:hypothetical protein
VVTNDMDRPNFLPFLTTFRNGSPKHGRHIDLPTVTSA